MYAARGSKLNAAKHCYSSMRVIVHLNIRMSDESSAMVVSFRNGSDFVFTLLGIIMTGKM